MNMDPGDICPSCELLGLAGALCPRHAALDELRLAAEDALTELDGYADAGCSNKAAHICNRLRAALAGRWREERNG